MVRVLVVLVAFISTQAFAEDEIPSDFYAAPSAKELKGYSWGYRQGLDFHVLNYRRGDAPGVSFYMGVSPSQSVAHDSDGAIAATILGKDVTLYRKCNRKGENCRFTSLVDTGVMLDGKRVWTRIWVAADNEESLSQQVDWLNSLKFSPYEAPQAAGL